MTGIYQTYDVPCHMSGISILKHLWECSFVGSCMNPRLSLHSVLAGWKSQEDLLGRVPLFLRFLDGNSTSTALPFLTGTQHCQRLPLNPAVQTVKDLHQAGAAMFTGSTHGCGFLAGPSLELEGFGLLKQKGFADSPGMKHPGALGRHERPVRLQLKRYDKHMPGPRQAHAWHMLGIYIHHTFSELKTIFAGLSNAPSLGSKLHMSLLNHHCCYIISFLICNQIG